MSKKGIPSFRDQFLSAINKSADRAFYLSQDMSLGNVTNVISTQAPSVDRIIAKSTSGDWGIPCGRSTFIVGEPSTSKTTVCHHLCAETQARGGIAMFIDGEHRYDEQYAKNIGVNTDTLLISKPDTLEDGLETINVGIGFIKKRQEELIKQTKIKDKKKAEAAKEHLDALTATPLLIIFDSVSIKTIAEMDGRSEKGGHARAISSFLRDVTSEIAKLNIALVFVCQKKSKINIGWGGGYGPQETWLAESALRFHCTIGLKTMKLKTLKNSSDDNDSNKIGDVVKVICIKNSCVPPFQGASMEVYYGKGINYYVSLCELLVKHYGAKKTSRTYTLDEPNLEWVDKGGLKKVLESDAKKAREIRKLLRKPCKRIKI